jgi:hypothetical protein
MIIVSITHAQVTVYNNFGEGHEGWDYTYTTGWTIAGIDVDPQFGVEQAMQFDSDVTGVVTDIWVAISKVPMSSPPDTVIIRLAENPSGQPPADDDIMEEWMLTSFAGWSQWNTPHHLEGSGTSQLVEGNSYWLWAIAKDETWTMWCLNEDPALTIPHTLRREDEDWLPIGMETASAFRVDVIEGIVGEESNVYDIQNNSLSQNFPNPFQQSTSIAYSIVKPDHVNLSLYDIYGKHIQTLINCNHNSGNYSINFDAKDLPGGIYIYKLKTGNKVVNIKKMTLAK